MDEIKQKILEYFSVEEESIEEKANREECLKQAAEDFNFTQWGSEELNMLRDALNLKLDIRYCLEVDSLEKIELIIEVLNLEKTIGLPAGSLAWKFRDLDSYVLDSNYKQLLYISNNLQLGTQITELIRKLD